MTIHSQTLLAFYFSAIRLMVLSGRLTKSPFRAKVLLARIDLAGFEVEKGFLS